MRLNKLITIAIALTAAFLISCESELDENMITGTKYLLRFTDGNDLQNVPEITTVDGNDQTIDLKITKLLDEKMPSPNNLRMTIIEWDDINNEWDEDLIQEVDANQPDDFYHVTVENNGKEPYVKIRFSKNTTGKQRQIKLWISSDIYGTTLPYGEIIVTQLPVEEPLQ